MPKNVLFH